MNYFDCVLVDLCRATRDSYLVIILLVECVVSYEYICPKNSVHLCLFKMI